MNWVNLQEATAPNEKPSPGWLFRDICRDAQQYPKDIPDTAEYLMRCVASENRTVCMKACLAIFHLADEVPDFRQYMQRCPEALEMLREAAQPPQLVQAQSIERPQVKVARESAARALRSCLAQVSIEKETAAAQLKERMQGFGNFAPPEEEQPPEGARGLVDKVAGFVGDAVADTVDDFREKGALGAVRDGIADAADLLADGVGAVWGILGGRRNQREPVAEDRICCPRDNRVPCGIGTSGVSAGSYNPTGAYDQAAFGQGAASSASPYQGAFGQGLVGAGYGFHAGALEPSLAGATTLAAATQEAAPAPAPAAPAPPPEPEDLIGFDDPPSPRSSSPSADLLSFDGPAAAGAAAQAAAGSGGAAVLKLKDQGNDLVRKKKHGEAVKAYEAALVAMDADIVADGKHEALRATLYANIAMCYLQQQLYRRAVDAATSSIEIDATHAKAHYRRCLAYRALKMFSEAQKDLEALQYCRHDMSATEMQRLHASIAAGLAAKTATSA